MTLTKAKLSDSIHKQVGLTRTKSDQMVDSLVEIIKKALEGGEDVLISGFGKFCVKDKKPRRWRNYRTGEYEILDERRVVRFRCSEKLRDRMNREG